MLFSYTRIGGLSQRGLTLYLDLVAGAVWWSLFGSFFSFCFEGQWFRFMFDFCRYDAFLQVKPYFGRRGVISDLVLVLWCRPGVRSAGVLMWRPFLPRLKLGG